MMSTIAEYLRNEKHMTEIVAVRAEQKISKHEDIRKEFEAWIKNRAYITDNPLAVNGYTALDISKLAPFMDGLGVFNFMVTLRDDHDNAMKYIEDGFKRK